MDVIFYYNTSDDRVIKKNILQGKTLQGVLRDEVSVMSPIVRFESDEVLDYNYAYIPALERYYSITDRTCYRNNIWDVSFQVDVLMSFQNDICNLNVIVDKQSMRMHGNEYIDDGSLVTENVMFKKVYNFQNGFNSTGEYILITAG